MHKLCCLLLLVMTRPLEQINQPYFSHVIAKVALMNFQELELSSSDNFKDLLKNFAVFNHSKVDRSDQYGEYVEQEDYLISCIIGEDCPKTDLAIKARNSMLLEYYEFAHQTNASKKAAPSKVKIGKYPFLSNLYELELGFSAPKRKPHGSLDRSINSSRSPSIQSAKVFANSKLKKSQGVPSDSSQRAKSQYKLKCLLGVGSKSVLQSTGFFDSKLASESKDHAESKLNAKDSQLKIVVNKSLDLEVSKTPKEVRSLVSSKETSPKIKLSRSERVSSSLEFTRKVKAEANHSLSTKGKSDISQYFLSRSKVTEKKKIYFFTEDNIFSEVKLPKRRFKHLCFASAIPKDDDDEDVKGEQAPDLDVYTVKAAPRSAYFKNNDMAGMLDDCLLGTFNKKRNAKNSATKFDPPVASDNMNKRYFKMQKEMEKEHKAFKFVKKALKTRHTDTFCSKDLNDFGRQDLVILRGTEDYLKKKIQREKAELSVKMAEQNQVLNLLGVLANKGEDQETNLKKLQRLIYDHRQELNLNTVFNYWRSLEKDQHEQLKVQKRLANIVATGLRNRSQDNQGLAKVLIKAKADELMETNFRLEVNKDKVYKMKKKMAENAAHEKKTRERTLAVIEKHKEFMNSAKEYCHRNPASKLFSIFDLVKGHKRGSIKISP